MPDYVNIYCKSLTELTAGCRLFCMCVVSLRVSLLLGVCLCERDNIDVNKMQELAKIKTEWTNTLVIFILGGTSVKIQTSTTWGKINFTGFFLHNSCKTNENSK